MTDTTLTLFAGTREGAHQAITAGYDHAKTLIGLGKRVKLTVAEAEDEKSIKQRAFLHTAVFPQIEQQVVFPDGARFERRVWKEMFRARFLGDRWVQRAVPRWDKAAGRWIAPKRKTPHRERISTEDLGLRAYSDYIDLVIDTATLEYGVQFRFLADEREAVRHGKPARQKNQQPSRGAVETRQPEEATP